MLLVIYNSNPQQNKPDTPTIKGWSLFTSEDWQSLWMNVDSYFFNMPIGDAELEFGVEGIGRIYYTSHEEWLADYQVSEVDINKPYFDSQLIDKLDLIFGTNIYIPFIAQNLDDEIIYPEMDVD